MSKTPLQILVIHGYVQSAATVAHNTTPLREALRDVAVLHYVDGPPVKDARDSGSRPWWLLGQHLQQLPESLARWEDTIAWWEDHLSRNSYDGVIGLSQGAAMAALLVSMLNDTTCMRRFPNAKHQPFKFAVMCSGFVSDYEPHKSLYRNIPVDLPTLHTVDLSDSIVRPEETVRLKKVFPRSILLEHNEGHSVPVQGDWPQTMLDFLTNSCNI